MGYTKTELVNMALAHLGVGQGIDDFDTDTSAEAGYARQFFDIVRDQVFRDFPHPWAMRQAALALVNDDEDVAYSDEYFYAFRYPADCLHFNRLVTGSVPELHGDRVPFRQSYDAEGKLILTNVGSSIVGEYTALVTDTTLWPSDFSMCVTLRLAWRLSSTLPRGDVFGLGKRALQEYMMETERSRANAANEEEPEAPADAPWISGR